MRAETEWVLVTLQVPETYEAWITALRAFLVERGRVFVSLGASSIVMRRVDFEAAVLAGGEPAQSEKFYRIRAFSSPVMDMVLAELPVGLVGQLIEEAVGALRRTR